MPGKKRKKDFGEGYVYTSANYLMWFLQGNFYFWLMNLPFIAVVALMFLSQDDGFALFLALSALPMGPALTALFSVMGKLIREKDVNVTTDFFKAYKVNFFESIFFWTLELAILLILYIDKVYLIGQYNSKGLEILFLFLLFMCVSMTFHIFPILSRFYLKRMDILRLAFYFSVRKIYIGILSCALIYLMWSILMRVPFFSLLIIVLSVSVLCYVVMYMHKGTLLELEEKFKEDIN